MNYELIICGGGQLDALYAGLSTYAINLNQIINTTPDITERDLAISRLGYIYELIKQLDDFY